MCSYYIKHMPLISQKRSNIEFDNVYYTRFIASIAQI